MPVYAGAKVLGLYRQLLPISRLQATRPVLRLAVLEPEGDPKNLLGESDLGEGDRLNPVSRGRLLGGLTSG